MNSPREYQKRFLQTFGVPPLMVRSPGRVNLLGEHTDYNQGFVLPAAIGKSITIAIAPRDDEQIRIVSADLSDEYHTSLISYARSPKGWPNYIMGVVDQLRQSKHALRGFDCLFGGDIPIGAGLSSSAAIEAGMAFALNTIFRLGIDKLTLVKIAQKAENEFVGVKCGIMDQYINIFGEAGSVLRIDCRSLEHLLFSFDFPGVAIVLFDTGVTHSLASSEYNKRRAECQEGVSSLQKSHPGITSLRDVSPAMLSAAADRMPPVVLQRCAYVVGENERMKSASTALLERELGTFGALMYRTHEGLRDEYSVSCPELDFLVETVRTLPQVFGARMMGGGFGGCTINLVEEAHVDTVRGAVTEAYRRQFGTSPKTYVTTICAGTSIIEMDSDAD